MTTVPASTRTTSYTLASASAGPFLVGFRLFDPALEVYVNDALRSDYTLSATFTGGYSDTASITFSAALASGSVITIKGAQPISRAAEYIPSDPQLTAKMNIELGRVWAAMQQIERDRAAGLTATDGPWRNMTDFGELNGTDDDDTWTAALAWAKSTKGAILLPPSGTSVISGINLVSFARVYAFGHTIRIKGATGFVQPAGQQVVDFEMYGASIVPHTGANATARVFDLRVIQRCTIRARLDGFNGGHAFRVQGEVLTSRDLLDLSQLIGSNNIIDNDVDIFARGIATGFDISGAYGTTPTPSPANSSPSPISVATKNKWKLFGWAVTQAGAIARKCCDGDLFVVDAQYSANGARAYWSGNGTADTFIGNNYVNSNEIQIVAAVAAGVTSMTLVYADAWSFRNRIFVYHDIDFTTVTVTEVGLNGGMALDDFDYMWTGSGADTTLGNTANFYRSENDYNQAAAGLAVRPSYAFNRNRGTGMYMPIDGLVGFACNGVLSGWFSQGGFGLIDGTAVAPAMGFMALSGIGIYRTGTSLGVATSGVARAIFADTFFNVTVPLFVNGAAAVTTTGRVYDRQGAPATKAGAATLTAAEVESGILTYTGGVANVTFPTATDLDTGLPILATDRCIHLSVINTGAGAATMITNTGLSLFGSMVVASGASGLFRIRRTGAAAYSIFRIA